MISEPWVRVTNKNNFEIVDRHAGIEYTFSPNRSMTIPLDVAEHIFGWHPGDEPGSNFMYMRRRWGWNTPKELENPAPVLAWLENIVIETISMRTVEVPTGVTEAQVDLALRHARGKAL